ncbi:MAG: transcription termination/antitermination factor NusG [Candidatus Schekmanbacteria bacterium]|nr:transcription termination/antitermination factor NusG [Candidatus Schekmanbacteria bacterium]
MDSEMNWYVVHTYAGYENKVKANLEERVKASTLCELFGDILVPAEKVQQVRRGKKVETERKFLPSYLLIRMVMNDQTWALVKNTPKVTGFVGTNKPSALRESEVKSILQQMESSGSRPQAETKFRRGDRVRITDGPFANFVGVIDEANSDKNTLRVMVTIFGRSTPVELDFVQAEPV